MVLGGCAPQGKSAKRHLTLPKPQFGRSSDAEWRDPVMAAAPAAAEIPEPELTFDQELKDLKQLGQWEEGAPPQDIAEDVAASDFPITINRQVEYYLDFFQNKHRRPFAKWLARSGRYRPMIEKQLREAGLPRDLAYLAMIESGYNTRAYSKAKAVGLWQFIKPTGRNYDLAINSYVDERRDAEKSTRAAVAYLSGLYQEFGSWYLAVAAYNAGEGKIRRAISKYNTTNFWELAQGSYLRLETKKYVPKLIAAILIAKAPEKYGFHDISYAEPLAYETVEVPRWTALKAVALATDVDFDELRELNRELTMQFTPPHKTVYPLKVPAGKGDLLLANLPRVHATVNTSFKTHIVRAGESIDSVCRRYGLTRTIILKSNNLRSARLQPGQRLRIPFHATNYELLPEGVVAPSFAMADGNSGDFILHKVHPGETISGLATLYNVPSHMIAGWNNIKNISRIRAGQQLALYVRSPEIQVEEKKAAGRKTAAVKQIVATAAKIQSSRAVAGVLENPGMEVSYYQVRNGDSLWDIARRFGHSTEDIRRWNNLDNDQIHPGDRLLLKESAVLPNVTYYKVRGGDTLWTIARKHNISMESIRKWNNLKNDVLHPGSRLLIKLVKDA